MSKPIMSKNENEELSAGKDGKQARFAHNTKKRRGKKGPRASVCQLSKRRPVIPVLSKQRLPR